MKTLVFFVFTASAYATDCRVLERPAMFYPPIARQSGLQGTVLGKFEVVKGAVKSLSVKGGPAVFNLAVQNTMRSWRFSPSCSDFLQIKFVYQLNGKFGNKFDIRRMTIKITDARFVP